jgi:predicted alpha/beta hydrolase family esterase
MDVRQVNIVVTHNIAVKLIVHYAPQIPAYFAIAHVYAIAPFKENRIFIIVVPVIEEAAIGDSNL